MLVTMNKKRILIIVVSIVIVAIVATVSVIVFHVTHPRSNTSETQTAADATTLMQQANKLVEEATTAESNNETEKALEKYQAAYTIYVQVKFTSGIVSIKMKIEFLKSILESEGKKANITIDLNTPTDSNETTPDNSGATNGSSPAPPEVVDPGVVDPAPEGVQTLPPSRQDPATP